MQPVVLEPNLMRRPYRGGSALAAFRGVAAPDDHCPEDWIASATTVFGEATLGLSVLPDGRSLRAAIEAEPEGFLGAEHVGVFGSDTGLLVKLIDAQQRLSVHAHPDRAFTRSRLGAAYGKTEAWLVVATTGASPVVHLGFTSDLAAEELQTVVESGEGGRLLDRLHRIPVQPGDAIVVPAGTPHAIGEGVLLVEVQEPSDLLVRLEWGGYAVGTMPSDLGLGFASALEAVDRTAWDVDRLTAVGVGGRRRGPDPDGAFHAVLPALADGFFRLDRAHVQGRSVVPDGFSVLIVLRGTGRLETVTGAVDLTAGQAILVPYAAGPAEVEGDLTLVCARPAAAQTVRRTDPALTELLTGSPLVH